MNSLRSSIPEVQAAGGEMLDDAGFETEDPATDCDPSEFLTEEGSEP